MKIMGNSLIFFLILTACLNVNAYDADQLMPGKTDDNSLENNLKKYKSNKTFLSNGSEEADYEKYKGKSSHLSGQSDGAVKKSGLNNKTSGIRVLGAVEDSTSLIEYSNEELVKKYRNTGKTNFSFSYFMDNNSYEDTSDTFDRTFDTSSEGTKGGSLIISGENYLSRGMLNVTWGMNAGAGFNTGKGIFANSAQLSDVKFNLWTFPVDLTMGFEIPIGSWLKLTASGGPSALGLWQTRSDRESGDKDKERRQVGFGYAATAKVKFNFSTIFPDTGVEMTSSYDLSDFFMNLEIRTQSYDNFGDDIKISGTSIGIGFTFEFL